MTSSATEESIIEKEEAKSVISCSGDDTNDDDDDDNNNNNNNDNNDDRPAVLDSNIPDFALPPVIVNFQKTSNDIEFTTDEEYFNSILACETARYYSYNIKYTLGRALNNADDNTTVAYFNSITVQNIKQYSEMLFELYNELDTKRQERLAITKEKGTITLLIEQFLINMNATNFERSVFYVTLCSASQLLSGFPGESYDTTRLDTYYWLKHLFPEQCSTSELFLTLVGVDSKWCSKEHIYQNITILSDRTAHICKMTDLMISVFMGHISITVSQYHELDSPTLQETLLQCKQFATNTTTGKSLIGRKLIDDKRRADADSATATETTTTTHGSKKKNAPFLKAMQESGMTGASGGASGIGTDRIFNILSEAAKQERELSNMNNDSNADEDELEDEAATDDIDNDDDNEDNPRPVDDDDDDDDGSGEMIDKSEAEGEDSGLLGKGDDDDDDDDNDDGIKVDDSDDGDENKHPKVTIGSDGTTAVIDDEYGPYKNNLQYLEDQISYLNKVVLVNRDKSKLLNSESENGTGEYYDDNYCRISKEQHDRLLANKIEKNVKKVKTLKERINIKLSVTKTMPRLEQLIVALELDEFERFVILNLIKGILMPNSNGCSDCMVMNDIGSSIQAFACTLEEKMLARKYFYKTSRLVQEGVLYVSQNDFMEDLTNCSLDLDRRMFDFLVGLDTEFSEVVDGSHLYMPNVQFDDAVLPPGTKTKILDRVAKFDEIKSMYNQLQLDDKITYGTGQVLLFYGSSGTGKTMMANAVATKLKKKVLLVNFPSLGSNSSGRIIKFLFREARIQKALLFFDECESLFHSRDNSNSPSPVNMILTELERFNGLCILATNRPMDLDEAMHRRITLAVEFHKPDRFAREQIWKNLHPPKLALAECVNFCELARKFELTGGHIKNAWLSAIGQMVQRNGSQVTQQDLILACSDQVIGRLSLEEFDQRVIPTCGLDAMVVSSSVKESLESIVQYTQAQTVLFGSWGFGSVHRATTGVSALFCGRPGTGKTMAAEAISFDLGKPLMVINIAELISKWVGETGKNIAAVFDGAKSKDVVLVFDEAEGLFGERNASSSDSVGRHDNMNVGLLLQYIENFSGVCIVITNKHDMIDDAFFRRFNYVVHFEPPTPELRLDLWKTMIPKECPLGRDVDLQYLANRYLFSGGDIKSAVFHAATRAALRNDSTARYVSQDDLEKACDEEEHKAIGSSTGRPTTFGRNIFNRQISEGSQVDPVAE